METAIPMMKEWLAETLAIRDKASVVVFETGTHCRWMNEAVRGAWFRAYLVNHCHLRIITDFSRFAPLPFSPGFGMICTQFFAKGRSMKDGIHPQYGDATITCACGNVIHTRSTKPEMQVNTCSACHPYFTGQKTMVDTEGRVDMFKKRYAKFAK